jgi:hypothetical protein
MSLHYSNSSISLICPLRSIPLGRGGSVSESSLLSCSSLLSLTYEFLLKIDPDFLFFSLACGYLFIDSVLILIRDLFCNFNGIYFVFAAITMLPFLAFEIFSGAVCFLV